LLDGRALPIIEIVPAEGLYDYEAKYTRDDTTYVVDPELPSGVADRIKEQTARVARALRVRHIARADFMLDSSGSAWFLEINTMPGFTDHSLVPKAARKLGLEMPELCSTLIRLALRDHPGLRQIDPLAGASSAA
jgi:D-alanine-D-alanine ligase